MSAALIIRDPDPEQRRRGVESAQDAMRRFDLETSSVERGAIAIVWGTFQGGPVRTAPDAFVMGDVIPGPGPQRLTASEYAQREGRQGVPHAFDGYHLAATFDEHGSLKVASDFLGAFPVYYATAGETLLVGTSPALITGFPGFDAAFDPYGLAALLVTNGSVRGRTPYRGIRRLAAGHVLLAAVGAVPREARHYAITLSRASHDMPIEECALRMYEALVEACRRHVPEDDPHTMLLSGGIDSRLLVGVLTAQGVRLNAITRGESSDLEYRCAKEVARHLCVPHHRVPHANETFEHFERTLWWEGLACGPGTATHDLGEEIPHMHPWVVAGYMADPILGGNTATKTFDRDAREASFDHYLRRTNAWGVPIDVLPGLLRRDVFGDSVAAIVEELREDFMNSADGWMARSWIHAMQLRERFAMGHMCGLLAFKSWPRLPQNDRAMIDVAAGIPLPVLAGRRLEHEILKRFHPDLARLPLDRNHPDTTPPLADVKALTRAGIDRRMRRIRNALGFPIPERRYYYRTYDFNGPGWRTLRRAAERDRERAYELFDHDVYESLVPPAHEEFHSDGTIEGAAAAKLLTGIAVWLRAGIG